MLLAQSLPEAAEGLRIEDGLEGSLKGFEATAPIIFQAVEAVIEDGNGHLFCGSVGGFRGFLEGDIQQLECACHILVTHLACPEVVEHLFGLSQLLQGPLEEFDFIERGVEHPARQRIDEALQGIAQAVDGAAEAGELCRIVMFLELPRNAVDASQTVTQNDARHLTVGGVGIKAFDPQALFHGSLAPSRHSSRLAGRGEWLFAEALR